VPTVSQVVPAQQLAPDGGAVTLDLRNVFAVPGVTGPVVQFDTVLGRFNVELREDAAPRHVANFLAYVQANAYASSFIHRSASLDPSGAISIVQGGGYRVTPTGATEIPRSPPVALEYNLPNARGTLAAARAPDVNSATSEWYFNVRDNSTVLGPSNGGGYTVFGRVIGTGMTVVDAIAALPRVNAGGVFNELPVRNYTSGDISSAHLAVVSSITSVTLFPTGGGLSAVELTLQNSAPGVVQTTLSGSTLTLSPLIAGTARITVRATDVNGNAVETSFDVTVANIVPAFTRYPVSQTVAAGSTVVFTARATGASWYEWQRNGVSIPSITSPTLVISNATAADAGTYTVTAISGAGTTPGEAATLTVINADPAAQGRLINLSVRTAVGSGADVLTMGAVIGPPGGSAALPVVVRAVGPTLGLFGVPGVLSDPVMTLNAGANVLDWNDNWGGDPAMTAAFASVGAFELPANSLDSAIVRTAPGLAAGEYTVQVAGRDNATGEVLAEMYDALGTARTASSPRLINLSVLKRIVADDALTAGFVIAGTTARTVLVRAIGPGLAAFQVDQPMADPQLTLYDRTQVRIADNDNWGGDPQLTAVGGSVGAFAIGDGASRDAMLVITLEPGDYTAEVTGGGGAGGTALVEVYEVR
jgi:cyclophilin family peptidyl-prolyl cis-trans isomerase